MWRESAPLAPRARRITDKMPANFRYAGLIHLALPNARIVHMRRDPVDTCLSCFSILFGGDQPFTYDLGELGRYYRAYQRLMEHWRAVLPPGVMIEVQYEALVGDFEPEARRILAHCGLEWNEACLDFHQTERPVHTASSVQVRQPIYRSSVGRWRPDAEELRPLLDALAASNARPEASDARGGGLPSAGIHYRRRDRQPCPAPAPENARAQSATPRTTQARSAPARPMAIPTK